MSKLKYFGKMIDLTEIYYIAYPDDRPQEKAYKEYYALKNMPDTPSKYDAIAQLPPEENPNVKIVNGYELVEITKKGRYIPQFDKDFGETHKLILMPAEAMIFYNMVKNRG